MRSAAVILVLGAAVTIASAADPAIEKLFRDAQAKILQNAHRVPRYACVQDISRTQYRPRKEGQQPSCLELIAARRRLGAPANIMLRDRLRLEVAVLDGKEIFSWAGAGRFETDRLETLVPGGATGTGGFVGFMAGVFGGDAQTVNYAGKMDDLARFDFTVPEARSHYSYESGKGSPRITGYSGYFLLDPDSAELNRLVIDTALFPASEPLCQVENEMDYQQVHIGTGDFLLPEVATMDVIYGNGAESLNETRYSGCREFTGESTIRFDDVDVSDSATVTTKALPPLAPKTRLKLALSTPIRGDTAAAGDAVTAVLTEDVRDKSSAVVAHRNDRVYGRIIRMEQDFVPAPRWQIAFQFDSLERNGVRQPVKLEPQTRGGVFTFPSAAGLYPDSKPVVDPSFRSEWETR